MSQRIRPNRPIINSIKKLRKPSISMLPKQPFDHLLVLDFEATCLKRKQITPQEIIEFPCVAVSTLDWEIKNVFHEYVKPRVHPVLDPHCIDLTGIMQEAVNEASFFPETFDRFNKWLLQNGFLELNSCGNFTSALVASDDWDLKMMLPSQCALDSLELPEFYSKWINLKKTYCETLRYYPRSLKDMFMRMEIKTEGRLHSGIDDVLNMIKIVQKLACQHSAEFKINSFHSNKDKKDL